MNAVILSLTIFNTLCLLFLVLFKLVDRISEMKLERIIKNVTTVKGERGEKEGVVDFPPPPLEEEEVLAGGMIEQANADSPTEESSEEREYLEEMKREARQRTT